MGLVSRDLRRPRNAFASGCRALSSRHPARLWLYVRFTLSYRDVEDLLAERGLDVSYETVWRWVLKFGLLFARELRRRRPRPTSRWHLDEMAVVIAGRQFWLWRAVDDEGEVLDLLVLCSIGPDGHLIAVQRIRILLDNDSFQKLAMTFF